MEKMVERFSCGIHYYVDPTAPADIYFDNETKQRLMHDGCDMSVTGLSAYLKEHSTSYSPVLLTWDMTSRCNFTCPFCYIRNNEIGREIRFEETISVIDGLVSDGLFEVYLSGGECLLVKDFVKIYRYIKSKGVYVTIFTNGSLIDDSIIQCWKELPPSSVEITLYDNEYTSKPFINVLKLRDMGIHVLPKFTLTQSTIRYYEGVKRWAETNKLHLAVDAEIFDGTDDQHSQIEKNYSLSVIQKKELTPNKYNNIESECNKRKGIPCKSRKGTIQINPDFSISLCNKMKKRWDLRHIEVKTAVDELREFINKYENAVLHGCNGCKYNTRCNMCYANAEIIDEELWVPNGHCDYIKEKYDQYS